MPKIRTVTSLAAVALAVAVLAAACSDTGDPGVDPEYLTALATCGSDVSVTGSLVELFGEDPDARRVTDIPDGYRGDDAIAALVAIDGFTSCLADAGFEWLGLPGESSDPDALASSPAYQVALADCQGRHDVQVALDDLLD